MPPRRRRSPDGPWATLAEALAERRRLLGLTQQEAADLSDLSVKALRDIESGTVAPRLGALVAVAEALGLDVALVPRSARNVLPAGSLVVRRQEDQG